ncbi:hypothetical protein M9Y10_023968 [Tritrichomonas musculus]|uniref:DUF3447 domain-containing protein n=1 Tax=Tritrichomonas musculus TaxID=1915356 RepID=A0ABR2KXN1_9EUKA
MNGYFANKRKLHSSFIEYIESTDDTDKYLQNLISFIEDTQLLKDKPNFNELLHMVNYITNEHYRTPDFFQKTDAFLSYIKNDIQNHFSNIEIFNIFQENKRILLSLFNEKIIIPNKEIANRFFNIKFIAYNYVFYFFKEISPFISENAKEKILDQMEKRKLNQFDSDEFENKRLLGENDNHICMLIRNDFVEDFIAYTNSTNYDLSAKIKPSIFETNHFLIEKKQVTLIEYSAFCGSIQIFNYLRYNNVELKSPLWIFSIHGNNPDIIHLLEEYHVKQPSKSILFESIKCHQNNYTDYIQNNLLDKSLNELALYTSVQFYNFDLFRPNVSKEFFFFQLCQFNYINGVKIFLRIKELDVNERTILKHLFLLIKFPFSIELI